MTRIKIIDLIPVTEYSGAVYEQTVVAEIDDDHSIKIFDGSVLLTDDDLETECEVTLVGRMIDSKQDSTRRGVWRPSHPSTEWAYMLGGTIKSVDTEGHLVDGYKVVFEFDIGVCNLFVKPDSERRNKLLDGELAEGRDMVIEVSRIDITSIERP